MGCKHRAIGLKELDTRERSIRTPYWVVKIHCLSCDIEWKVVVPSEADVAHIMRKYLGLSIGLR